MAKHDAIVNGNDSVQPPIVRVNVGDTVKWEGAGGKKIRIWNLPPVCDPTSSGPEYVNNFTTRITAPIPGGGFYEADLDNHHPTSDDGDDRPRLENDT